MSFTAKSVILDISSNWGSSSNVGIRQVDFYLEGSKLLLTGSDFEAYATDTSTTRYGTKYAFDTSLSLIGSSWYTSWMSYNSIGFGGKRLIVVFNSPQTFDSIVVNNFHYTGSDTIIGAKDVIINISTDAITDITYNASISNSTLIFDGQFDAHVASNIEDGQVVVEPPQFYSVTYDGNGNNTGSAPTDSQIYSAEDSVIVLGNTGSLGKTDYVFGGWNTDSTGTGTSYNAEDTFTIDADVTLYAVWVVVCAPLNIDFLLDAGDIIGDAHTTISALSFGLAINIATSLQSVLTQPFKLGLEVDMGSVLSFETGSAIIRYFCILTGSADGTTDLTLPMSSFQARRRSGDPTYLSVVIPTVDYGAQISARANGTLKIQQAYEQNGVIKQTETIIETSLDEVNMDEGGTNKSVTLIGYSTSTYYAKNVMLSGVTYRSTRSGKYHYRLARPYIFLNPGDTVTFSDDGVSFIVDTMSYFINSTTNTIELAST